MTLVTMLPGMSRAAAEISVLPIPRLPTIWQAAIGGGLEVRGHPRARLAEEHLLGHHAPEGDLDEGLDLGAGLGEALLLLGVRQEPEGVLALDDGQDLHLATLADEPRHGGVARFVGGDGAALGLGVLDGLGQADLLGHLGLLDVVPTEPRRRRGAAPTPAPRREGARA